MSPYTLHAGAWTRRVQRTFPDFDMGDLCSTPIRVSPPRPRASLYVLAGPDVRLVAGTLAVAAGARGSAGRPVARVEAPSVSMLGQLAAQLALSPEPPAADAGDTPSGANHLDPLEEGHALALLAVRWGSYFATLADDTLPLMPEVVEADPAEDARVARGTVFSRIVDCEMHRMNLEVSSNLAQLLRWRRVAPIWYNDLLRAALRVLPSPPLPQTPARLLGRSLLDYFCAIHPVAAPRACYAPAEARERMVANAVAKHGWRHGPIEGIHAGSGWAVPVGERRITAAEATRVFTHASGHFAQLSRVGALGPLEGETWESAACHAHMMTHGWSTQGATLDLRFWPVVESPRWTDS